ncbi:hypothetical protein BDZ85DRAFT_252905 [Elsinoe ampelina]|uniref:F-box domain-containing protein n=1 Tax=Elsinoe ampelina TaxID=302913 RepID=A0A6A6G177_9PEZI|nr:hypothetical protein BDZ85DRAFT_252905 [Elsinoe ampelina]
MTVDWLTGVFPDQYRVQKPGGRSSPRRPRAPQLLDNLEFGLGSTTQFYGTRHADTRSTRPIGLGEPGQVPAPRVTVPLTAKDTARVCSIRFVLSGQMASDKASLLSLPDELLDLIFSHFLDDPYTESKLWSVTLSLPEPSELVRNATSSRRPNYGRYALRSLSSVCHRLHQLATPWLYHTFPTSTAMWYPVTNRIPLRTCQFLVSLLVNPSLAKHVRRLVLHPLAATWWAHESPFYPSQPPEYAIQSRRLESITSIRENIDKLGIGGSQLSTAFRIRLHSASRMEGFVADRIRGYEPIEAQLLLAITPRLETLIWSDWRSEAGPEVANMLRHVNATNLKTLIVDYAFDLGTLDQWGNLGRFQTTQTSISCGCERVYYTHSPGDVPRGMNTTPVNTLTLSRTRSLSPMSSLRLISPCSTGLRTLLATLPGLRSLHIRLTVDFHMRDISQSWGRVAGSWTDVLSDIGANPALLDTIEDLVLDSVVKNPEEGMMTTDNWPIHASSLHAFQRLKSLEVHQSAFISFSPSSSFPTNRRPIAEVVPETLERLKILCFDAGLLGQMDEFVQILPATYKVLKRLEVQTGDFCCFDVNRAYPPHNLVRSSEDHIEGLYRRCRERGVDFVEMA